MFHCCLILRAEDTESEICIVCRLISDLLYTNQLHTNIHLRLVWIMSIEVLVKVLMDERSEWAKVRDELRVMLTTMFTFTTDMCHK